MALLHPSHIRWPLARASEPGKRAVIVDENARDNERFQESGDSLAGIIGDQHDHRYHEIHHIPGSILL